MLEIVIATGNPHKVEEMTALFAAVAGVKFRSLAEIPGTPFPEPEEIGHTFEENASIKALAYAKATGRLCIADDSGLVIDALGGRPGVISSHYCTDGREAGMSRVERDAANNERVLRELKDVPAASRTARFVCVMALASPAEVMTRVTGTFEGRIGMSPDVPRGSNGFGYDPLFLVGPDYLRTSAELDFAAKNAISHRTKAARLLVPLLDAIARAALSLPSRIRN